MGETNSPSVAYVGYDISVYSQLVVKFLIELSWVEKYRKPRATEGESIYNFRMCKRFIKTLKYCWCFLVTDNEDLTDDSEVDFWMNLRCSDDLLQQGQFYIIYGNGGYKYVDEFGTERYVDTNDRDKARYFGYIIL